MNPVSFNHVKIGSTDSARLDPDQNMIFGQHRLWDIGKSEGILLDGPGESSRWAFISKTFPRPTLLGLTYVDNATDNHL